METDDVIKRIVMLTLLIFITPLGDPTWAVGLIVQLILLITIILLSMTQIQGLDVFIPENLLEKGVWLVIFVCSILLIAIKLLSYP